MTTNHSPRRSIADCLLGFFPLRTVQKKLLKPGHWSFPDFFTFSQGSQKAHKQELNWLETAVAYEYAREFESLALLHQKEICRPNFPRRITGKTPKQGMKDLDYAPLPVDTQGYWDFCSSSDRLGFVLTESGMSKDKKKKFSLAHDRWSVGFIAAPEFPDKPFTLNDYIRSGRSPGKVSHAVLNVARLQPGEHFNLPYGVEPIQLSYYVIAVNWQCSVDELKKLEFPRWIDRRVRDEKPERTALHGRSPARVQEQALRDLGILRLCCQQGTIRKAMQSASPTKTLYQRRDQWEAACLRSMLLLAQWGLAVRTVADEFTHEEIKRKRLPLEMVAPVVAHALHQSGLLQDKPSLLPS